MVERFNGRIVSEVLAITVYSHDQLEQLLRGFNAAYNARRQRVLEGQTPDQVVAERLTAKPALAKAKPSGQSGPGDIIKARLIAESAKEVSQPDSYDLVVKSLAFPVFLSMGYATFPCRESRIEYHDAVGRIGKYVDVTRPPFASALPKFGKRCLSFRVDESRCFVYQSFDPLRLFGVWW